jgi:hypothetical protein
MNTNNDDKETILKSILFRFDNSDKESLAIELVTLLALENDGPPYQYQVTRLLDRELTRAEEFKLSVLNSSHNYIGGGGGGEEEEAG